MNGAIIPAVLWYLVTLNPSVPNGPITMFGPMEKADCLLQEKEIDDPYTWCQSINLKEHFHDSH